MARPVLLSALLLLFPAYSNGDDFISCGKKILSYGASRYEVRKYCGDPDDVIERTEYSFLSNTTPGSKTDPRTTSGVVRSVQIEEWFYNFGPHDFTETIVFVNGRLAAVKTGRYGE